MEAAPMAETHNAWRQMILNYSNTFKTKPSSWEEKAFAEDTAAAVWPPRSYSCHFCFRQFRSAQALGGHMNVHRRDRARLQNNPNPPFLLKPTPTSLDLHHFCRPKINGSDSSGLFSVKRAKLCVSEDQLDLELKL